MLDIWIESAHILSFCLAKERKIGELGKEKEKTSDSLCWDNALRLHLVRDLPCTPDHTWLLNSTPSLLFIPATCCCVGLLPFQQDLCPVPADKHGNLHLAFRVFDVDDIAQITDILQMSVVQSSGNNPKFQKVIYAENMLIWIDTPLEKSLCTMTFITDSRMASTGNCGVSRQEMPSYEIR